MTSHSVTTDLKLRNEIIRYLDAGGGPADFDVDGILATVQAKYGTVPIDDIPSEDWIDIVMVHDTSAVYVRPELQPAIDRLNRFFSHAHSDLPLPTRITCHVAVPTRAALDGMAGDFGLGVPEPAQNYRGAQFGVEVPGQGAVITVIFCHYEGKL